MEKKKKLSLPVQIFIALVLGIVAGLMFYNTLFDENACCHVAAGRGFSEVIEGFMDMTDEEIYAKGINDSMIHMDFMVGSDDLHIVGIREDGSEVDIFVDGTWAE